MRDAAGASVSLIQIQIAVLNMDISTATLQHDHHFCVRLRQFWHYLGGRSVAYAIGPFYALDKRGMLVST